MALGRGVRDHRGVRGVAAVRADNQVALVAGSAAELRALIADDYARRPVPR